KPLFTGCSWASVETSASRAGSSLSTAGSWVCAPARARPMVRTPKTATSAPHFFMRDLHSHRELIIRHEELALGSRRSCASAPERAVVERHERSTGAATALPRSEQAKASRAPRDDHF